MIAAAGTLSILVALGAAIAVAVQGFRHRTSGDRRAMRTPVLVLLEPLPERWNE